MFSVWMTRCAGWVHANPLLLLLIPASRTRLMYWSYKRMKAECDRNPPCHVGGFTRLLSASAPDDLMDEIPTMLVPPMPDADFKARWPVGGAELGSGRPTSASLSPQRLTPVVKPWAVQHWALHARIPEKYVWLADSDMVWLRPMRNPSRNGRQAHERASRHGASRRALGTGRWRLSCYMQARSLRLGLHVVCRKPASRGKGRPELHREELHRQLLTGRSGQDP